MLVWYLSGFLTAAVMVFGVRMLRFFMAKPPPNSPTNPNVERQRK